jgi:stage II sporulation protein AA (anti-sigma F factor antagonist)
MVKYRKENLIPYRIYKIIYKWGGKLMLLRFEQKGNILIIVMNGELDHHSSENVRVKIDNKIDELGSKNLIFDFSGVNFMDSSGIGVILGRYKKVTEYGGKAAIINLKPNIKRVFELSGLFRIINEYKNVDAAVVNM